MTTYTKRTNAKRAAIKAGIAEDQVEITVHKESGKVRFGFKQKEQVQAVAPVKAKAAAKGVPAIFAPAAPREERNGVKRPAAGGKCATAWEAFDQMHAAGTEVTAEAARLWAESVGANPGNAMQEIYLWRKFNGITRTPKATKEVRTNA